MVNLHKIVNNLLMCTIFKSKFSYFDKFNKNHEKIENIIEFSTTCVYNDYKYKCLCG